MIFISLILSLWWEQYRPLPQNNLCYRILAVWTQRAEHLFFAGAKRHAYLIWSLVVLVPSVLVLVIYALFDSVQGLAGATLTLGFSVLILYFCLGFGHFSSRFAAIQAALLEQDEEKARQLLAQALGRPKQEWTMQNMTTLLMQAVVPLAHIHALGVVVAYTVFALLDLGPTGAVLYRLAYFVYSQGKPVHALIGINPETKTTLERILEESAVEPPSARAALFQAMCARAWYWINWVPVHATVLAFAAVGSFENTISAWRNAVLSRHASQPEEDALAQETLLLDTAAAALSISYSESSVTPGELQARYPQKNWPSIQPEHLQNLVALGWRALLFWLFIVFLISLARVLA